MDILDELKAVIAKLDQEGIDYALCGGLAMAVYDLPRATLDIDLLIQVESLFRAKRALESLGFTLSGEPMAFHGGKIQIYRLCKIEPQTGEELVLDFLLVTPETAGAWETRREVGWEGRPLKVVSPQGLILLKSFRQSGKDQDDIEHLRNIADED
ncbi:MAG: nucleotidyltransferase family protein [Lentisphaeria bacterium]